MLMKPSVPIFQRLPTGLENISIIDNNADVNDDYDDDFL